MKPGNITFCLVGVSSIDEIDWPNPVNPKKNPTGKVGSMIPAKNSPSTLGFKCKKWGNGQNNDKRAHWRKGRGLSKGKISLKYKAKVKSHS